MATLQPHLPNHPRPVHGARNERHPVPHAHGLRRAEDGPAAGHGPQQATGHAQQRQLKGHTYAQYLQAKPKQGCLVFSDQSPTPDTSKYPSTFTTHSTYGLFPSDLLFTLVQTSVIQRGLDFVPQSLSSQYWLTGKGATCHHDKAQLSATLHLNYLLLCKRKKYHECNPVLRILIDGFFFILFSSFHIDYI